MITVVAALIVRDNKVLITKRSTGDPNVFGKWEFPGGKVKENELEEHAIERELQKMMELEAKEEVEKMEDFLKNRNDSEGYDILSFEQQEDGSLKEIYIEVKSTKDNEGTPIDITDNELEFAKKHIDQYYLYRIYNSDKKNKILKIVSGKELLEKYICSIKLQDLFWIRIVIPEYNFEMSWNLGNSSTWAIDKNSINEIGCIHTCQGLEFDYVGVIIGDDMRYEDGHIVTDYTKRTSTDNSLKGIKKIANEQGEEIAQKIAENIIKNTYRTLMTREMKGCYVYCTNKNLQEYLNSQK